MRVCFAFVLTILILTSSCKEELVENNQPCPPLRIVSPSPYGSPIWHPDGGFIGFNHTTLERIDYPYGEHCQGQYTFQGDSAGFWLINADGTNMRRVFPYGLSEPAWSPDGQWIAFEVGAQIFKMRFTGTGFDTTTLTQLTMEGRNFFPTWSPSGLWIAYDRSFAYPEPPDVQGTWIMSPDGNNKTKISSYRSQPSWLPDGSHLLIIEASSSQSTFIKVNIYDTTTVENIFSTQVLVGTFWHPMYVPNDTNIAFVFQPTNAKMNIGVIEIDGSNFRQLTTEGVGSWLDLSPDGRKIVYVSYRADDWTYTNGTLWILDIQTGQKRPLTFNTPPAQ